MEWVSGNILIRPNGPYPKGHIVFGHAHNFDHTTFVMVGAIRLREIGGRTVELTAPAHALVRAGVYHEITSLVDGSVFWCVYSHRDPQGGVVQRFNGWERAYGTTLEPRPKE